jgi:alkanesulfonate monooxygenase SsuD/methylene tetrahydromethanopterin reductase-like flavin-dependent oxidoreductase (luciferase family)
MRIGIQLDGDLATSAAGADDIGAFGVLVRSPEGVASVLAPPVIEATRDARILVEVALGEELPITLAEELTVLDAISGGRIVAFVTTGDLDADAAEEDVLLLRAALSGRPVRHRGARWTVPAGLHADAPESLIVTPPPVQLELPVWLSGPLAAELGERTGLPVVAEVPEALAQFGVQPGVATLTGVLDDDLHLVRAWMLAGATHLLVRLSEDANPRILREYVARHLIPEVGMVDYPRVMSEATPPPVWPGDAVS